MIAGVVASIRWAYYDAARVEGYAVRRDKEAKVWTVTGRIVQADAFKLSQRPLVFLAPFAGGCWSWRILDPVPTACGPFTVRLSDPLEATHADTASAHLLSAP